jgi:hypothetical protein
MTHEASDLKHVKCERHGDERSWFQYEVDRYTGQIGALTHTCTHAGESAPDCIYERMMPELPYVCLLCEMQFCCTEKAKKHYKDAIVQALLDSVIDKDDRSI